MRYDREYIQTNEQTTITISNIYIPGCQTKAAQRHTLNTKNIDNYDVNANLVYETNP